MQEAPPRKIQACLQECLTVTSQSGAPTRLLLHTHAWTVGILAPSFTNAVHLGLYCQTPFEHGVLYIHDSQTCLTDIPDESHQHLGSPVEYLTSHQTDAESSSPFFSSTDRKCSLTDMMEKEEQGVEPGLPA